jgi:flagellar biogenesis protein FliO
MHFIKYSPIADVPLAASQGSAIGCFISIISLIFLVTWPAELSAQGASSSDAGTAMERSSTTTLSPMPLKQPAATDSSAKPKLPGGISPFLTIGGSLAIVLGLFLGIMWLLRQASPRGFGVLPAEVFESLGRAPLPNHQQVQLLRCGNRLILISIGITGVEPLAEITDPSEVERLTMLCHQPRKGGSSTTSFRQVLRQAEGRSP